MVNFPNVLKATKSKGWNHLIFNNNAEMCVSPNPAAPNISATLLAEFIVLSTLN
jgi:hypothetical protein